MAQEIKMSASGLKAMQDELEYLKTVRRKELAEEIKATATFLRTASTMKPRTPRVWWRTASPSWSRWSRTL